MELSEFDEADRVYDEILVIDPLYTDAIADKGTVQLAKGNYKSAITFYDRALKMAPGNVRILYNKNIALKELANE